MCAPPEKDPHNVPAAFKPIMKDIHLIITIMINKRPFRRLLGARANITLFRKEEVPDPWRLIPGPELVGVGGSTFSYSLQAPHHAWFGPENTSHLIILLITSNLSMNVLGWDLQETRRVILLIRPSKAAHPGTTANLTCLKRNNFLYLCVI